jgi:DNA modification methylase
MKISTKEIVFREDLYPRFEADQQTIQKYADSVEHLPPIQLNQNKILIDGYHRWKAHELAGETEIAYETVETESDKHIKQLAYQTNSNHGLQLKNDEKRRFAQEMFGQMDKKLMSQILGVSTKTIDRWTETQAKAQKEDQKRQMVDLYLRAWNGSYKNMSTILGEPESTIKDIVKSAEKGHLSNFGQNFKPLIYNIWNTPKQDNDRKHFGAFPEVFMENLLHYHTNPLDIVYDPFAGGGTTADVCKRMFRRYYLTDRKVVPGREKDIREHDISNGLPEDLPKPDFVFLDPPYWKQAENKYSEDASDLGNMTLDDFNASMDSLFKLLSDRKVKTISAVIQPTQYKNNFVWTDHIFDFDKMLPNYKIEMRYILPYSTQQYSAQMVDASKDKKRCLGINRDLVVWSLK